MTCTGGGEPMFESLTTTAVLASAGGVATEILPVVLLVLGLGLAFMLANWVVAKVRGGGRSKGKRGRRRRAA